MKKNKEYERLLRLPRAEQEQEVDRMSQAQRTVLLIYIDMRAKRAGTIVRWLLITAMLIALGTIAYVLTVLNGHHV